MSIDTIELVIMMYKLDYCFVPEKTLETLFSKLPYDGVADKIADLAPMIHTHMIISMAIDKANIRRAMRMWTQRTRFVPKKDARLEDSSWATNPLRQYTKYNGVRYCRDRHCAGIVLAVRLWIWNESVQVVWTATRQAHIYALRNKQWSLTKVLKRQDDAFSTWWKHLGGKILYAMIGDSDCHPTPADMFHNLVVPLFGSHTWLCDPSRQRGVESWDPIWEVIRESSDSLPATFDDERFTWVDCRTGVRVSG